MSNTASGPKAEVRRSRCLLAATLFVASLPLAAQQLEPRAYSVSPVGANAFLFAYSTLDGDVAFDPTLPIEDVKTVLNQFNIGYFRAVDFFGRSANVALLLPYTEGSVEGKLSGVFQKVRRSGLRDPAIRFAVNLHGAPAMSLKEFASYRQKWIVGASIVAIAPLGQYDPAKLVNIGANRWSFKPELGISRAIGKWIFEFAAGAWFFTANKDFQGSRKTQAPISSGQIHAIYTFRRGLWASFDANFFVGGRTRVDGVRRFDLQRNSRVGATVSIPLTRRQSLKVAYSTGAYTTIGANFRSISLAYQYIWGGGL